MRQPSGQRSRASYVMDERPVIVQLICWGSVTLLTALALIVFLAIAHSEGYFIFGQTAVAMLWAPLALGTIGIVCLSVGAMILATGIREHRFRSFRQHVEPPIDELHLKHLTGSSRVYTPIRSFVNGVPSGNKTSFDEGGDRFSPTTRRDR